MVAQTPHRFQTNFEPVFWQVTAMPKIGLTTDSKVLGMTDPVRGSSWITAQLRQAILDGRYAHGEKLPAERQFASAFGASRATIRSALIRLETERLLARRPRAGTVVKYEKPGERHQRAEITT